MAYTVKKGDTLQTIAKKTGNSVQDLQKWNNMVGTSPSVGGNLVVSSSDPRAKQNATKLAQRTGTTTTTRKPTTTTTTNRTTTTIKPITTAPASSPYGFGTVAQNNNVAYKWTDKNAEIERTKNVINSRLNAGMDVSAQLNHYKNLTGQNYTYAPTQGYTTTTPEGLLTEEQIQNMINQQAMQYQNQMDDQNNYWNEVLGGYQNQLASLMEQSQQPNEQYDELLTRLQAQYDELMKQLQYYQMLQQYYNMYQNPNAQNSYNPFM